MSSNIGQRIADPRQLSDELGVTDDYDDVQSDMYSNLANYTFGTHRASLTPFGALPDTNTAISPLSLPRLSPDRTPRPSLSVQPASPPPLFVSSHPSHGAGHPAFSHRPFSSQSRHSRDQSYSTQSTSFVSGSDSEKSEDPSSSTDPIIAAFYSSRRARLTSDTASQHTFGRASHSHGFSAASFQDGATPSSSSVSVATSRSSSRASMRTSGQFSSDDELEFDYYEDGNASPVTFARYELPDIDEDADLVEPPPPSVRSFALEGRRGSLPMAIPGAVQASDAYSTRSREGSILTVRRPSRSWDDSSTHRSSHSGEDPNLILPRSEPLSRADWRSVEAQRQAQQATEQEPEQPVAPTDVCDGFDVQYILSRRSEGSIRSVGSLSFIRGQPRTSPHAFLGSTTTLPIVEDSFMRHLQRNDRAFDDGRYFWSFQRERADASSSSARRRQQVHQHRTEKSGKDVGPRVQEMWRCGHVGRFKVDKLVFKPTAHSADSAKGTQQRIHVRHIPDPYLLGNTTSGPHSVIHKHSRAIAFSVFRSHALFNSRQGGTTAAGPSSTQTHMNMRSGIMLAPKKVQEQYTSTKTTRQLSTHGLLDTESRVNRRGAQGLSFRERDSRDKNRRRGLEKEDRSKGKASGKIRSKDRNGKRPQRANLAESTESSSAGSITTSTVKQMVSAGERPLVKVQFSPSISSSTTASKRDSISRPVSPSSLAPPSVTDSGSVLDGSETASIPPFRYRDHRDSLDSDDRLPTRTTHAEAFSALDPNDIENLRAKANSTRVTVDSGSTLERFLRVFRSSSRTDDHSSGTQPRAFHPPWLITAGRDQQEENDRVLSDLNASFRDVGLLHTNPHRPSKSSSKRRSNQGILDQIPDDCLYMLLPLWPGETDAASVHPDTNSTASFVTNPENRQFLLVYYIPFTEKNPNNKKPEKKKAKHSHSSDSGVELDPKSVYLPEFRVVARMVTYDELRLSGVRVPSDGLAINGPEWEAISYAATGPPRDSSDSHVVVCQCLGRDNGFDFLEHGLHQLGLCTQEELSQVVDVWSETEEPQFKMVLTPIGRAAVEMIWLGCLAITSFGPPT